MIFNLILDNADLDWAIEHRNRHFDREVSKLRSRDVILVAGVLGVSYPQLCDFLILSTIVNSPNKIYDLEEILGKYLSYWKFFNGKLAPANWPCLPTFEAGSYHNHNFP